MTSMRTLKEKQITEFFITKSADLEVKISLNQMERFQNFLPNWCKNRWMDLNSLGLELESIKLVSKLIIDGLDITHLVSFDYF